jgi:hypothetical protein
MDRKFSKLLRASASASLALALLSVSGCAQDRVETEKKILSYDASFQTTLKKRDLLDTELLSLRAAFAKVCMSIDAQIAILRDKKARAKREYDASAEKIKLQFQPEIRKVERDVQDAEKRYELKSVEMREVERDMNEVNYLVKKKDKLVLTEEESKTWNSRLAELIEKKAAIAGDLAKIKEEMQIEKMKLKVMRLK